MNLTPNAPIVIAGAGTALFVVQAGAGTEFPMTKCDVKIAADKTEVTGSFSVFSQPTGFKKVWKEFGQGSSGGSCSWQSYWRVNQIVAPMDLVIGETYNIRPYVRRPQWVDNADPGSYFDLDLFIDDNSLSLDPKGGVIEWSVTTTLNGYAVFPD